MEDLTTISVERQVKETLAKEKPDCMDWNNYLLMMMEEELVDDSPELAERGTLESMQSALETLEERTGRIERALEDMGAQR